jgi:hypothetical protein
MFDRNAPPGWSEAAHLDRIETIAERLSDAFAAAQARSLREQLQHGRLNVLIAGQFKRGKSSLVNALVGAPILPVGVLPVTGVVASVRYAERPGARVLFSAGEERDIDAADVAKYVSEKENPRNELGVAQVQIGWPSALLKNIAIFDTPGVGSTNAWNTAQAREALPNADAAILVMGPEPPIGAEELAFAREVAASSERLFVVLNKADLAGERLPEVLDFTRRALRDALGIEDVDIYPTVASVGSSDPGFRRFARDVERFISSSRLYALESSAHRRSGALAARLLVLVRMRIAALALPGEQRVQKAAAVARAIGALDARVRALELVVDDDVRRLQSRLEALLQDRHDAAVPEIPALAAEIAAEGSSERRAERVEAIVAERAAQWRDAAKPVAAEAIDAHTSGYARELAALESAILAAGAQALGMAQRVPDAPALPFSPASLNLVASSIPTTGLELLIDRLTMLLPPGLRTRVLRVRAASTLRDEFDALAGKMRYGISRDLDPWRRRVRSTISAAIQEARAAVLAAFDVQGPSQDDAAIEEHRSLERELEAMEASS